MELTRDFLVSKGFESNHPDRVLCNLYLDAYMLDKSKSSKESGWRINIQQNFDASLNKLSFNVWCEKSDETGKVIKRSSVENIVSVEELNKVAELSDIDVVF